MVDLRVSEFIEKERSGAKGQRLEMLERNLHGTIKLIETVLFPVFGSLDGFRLEYEFKSPNGYNFYADLFHEPLQTVFECDGYVPHAELLTRERFSMERQRIRTMTLFGYRYLPFSWDELDKKGEQCRRAVYELVGRCGHGNANQGIRALPIQDRELLRLAANGRIFRQPDAQAWLGLKEDTVRKITRRLMDQGWLAAKGNGNARHHAYHITDKGWKLFWGNGVGS
ncbi:hypothetical protein ACTHPH_19710 [Paenibacillus pasadenensis]|uniref:hypothetical protein n=1 Tax=Paenibacillus TaxID=44249 RepID=UPI00048FEEBB|nr:hypothetical protein [Paenibacillus pasadenensis]